ncbi:MAG: hypothetical protein H7145_17650 [Akkermansiaceae bacterium]|nr:hypothetical protein [Armatimonadota bacterium]
MVRLQTDTAHSSHSALRRLRDEGKYLALLALTEKQLQTASWEQKNFLQQGKAGVLSLCGDNAGALLAMDAVRGSLATRITPAEVLPGSRLRDAREEIVRQAGKRQVVVLNEAHHVSRHRAFGLGLLPYLRRLGFTHFAAEAFGTPRALQRTIAGRTVLRSAGGYIEDTVFGAYVQTAIDLGFTLVPYEIEESERVGTPDEQINTREAAQASNLYERIFKRTPQAKVFIHVGYNHAMRTPVVFEEEGKKTEITWMAGRLTKLLGTSLLTIDQTGGTERGSRNAESSRVRGVLERPDLKRPSLVQKADGSFLAEGIGEDCDLTVFHPRQKLRNGRPDWLLALPGRRAVPLPASLKLPRKGRALLQATRDDAPEDAVSADRCLINPDTPLPVLVLPKGRYRLSIQDEAGNASEAGRFSV